MSDKNTETKLWVKALVVVVIILLIPFAIKLLKASWLEFKESYKKAQKRHEELEDRIENNQALKEKLERKFKNLYFLVRFSLVVLWASVIGALYYWGYVQNLEDVLNYSEALILAWCTVNFLFYGSFSNIKGAINSIRIRLENRVWRKHLDLEDKIKQDKAELAELKRA